ncbi:MAG: hypothetical protein WAV89_07775, partial [Ignavibacteriaceae bacterium]
MLSIVKIHKKIKSAFWDYNIDSDEIYLIALDKKAATGIFSKEKILVRLIERLSWYELIDLFGKEYFKENLDKSLINKIRNPEIRQRYEFIRQILQGKAVSTTGWS